MSSELEPEVPDRKSAGAQKFFKARENLIANEKLQRSGI
jgi:hypothetical protein